MKSDDGSSFQIQTKITADSTSYYTDASTYPNWVSCYKQGFGSSIGGQYSTIAVVITCGNALFHCPIHYNADVYCQAVATPVTPGGGTNTPPANPNPPTPTPTNPPSHPCDGVQCGAFGTCNANTGGCVCIPGYGGSKCETALVPIVAGKCNCACCTGVGCIPSNLGSAGTSCSASTDCNSLCLSTYPNICPSTGVSGTIKSMCASTSSSVSGQGNSGGGGSNSGLDSTAIIGIVIGAIAGAALVGIGVYYWYRSSQEAIKTQQNVAQIQMQQQKV
jgi:hypothetical protein